VSSLHQKQTYRGPFSQNLKEGRTHPEVLQISLDNYLAARNLDFLNFRLQAL